ncbi:apses-domain-containing protein [Backusella circina FSU 941]|nr:apses-domain-containing protein [Backusella circina FSU 941]
MEGIYQNNLYSSAPSPYVLQSAPSDHSFQHSHYGNQYRSSAFSEPRSPYHSQQHSAGLNASNTYSNGDVHENSENNYIPPHNNNSTGWASPNISWNSAAPPPLPPPSRSYSFSSNASNTLPQIPSPMQRPKLTTTVWEDEGTICYQVDAKSVCVARRQDNDMINGTKLLNVVGMSRGKRDGILKNEKGRVVVKVGAMHLKGVWITFSRAKDLASKFKIIDILYPLFVDDPSVFLSVSGPGSGLPMMLPSSVAGGGPSNRIGQYNHYKNENSFNSFNMQSWDKPYQPLPSISSQQQDQMVIRSQNSVHSSNGSPVHSHLPPATYSHSEDNNMYLLNNSCDYRSGNRPPGKISPYLYSDNHNSSSSFYENSNTFITSRKSTELKESSEFKTEPECDNVKRMSLPTSPPPEHSDPAIGGGAKFSSPYRMPNSGWSPSSDIHSNKYLPDSRKSVGSSLRASGLVMVPVRHPLSNEDDAYIGKSRKREDESIPLQRKRTKANDTDTI